MRVKDMAEVAEHMAGTAADMSLPRTLGADMSLPPMLGADMLVLRCAAGVATFMRGMRVASRSMEGAHFTGLAAVSGEVVAGQAVVGEVVVGEVVAGEVIMDIRTTVWAILD